jgi:signal transduction histidine kinase
MAGMRMRTAHALLVLAAGLQLTLVCGGLALWAVSGRHVTVAAMPAELALAIGLVGTVILWHRPRHRIGVLLAVTGGLFALGVLAGGVISYAATHPGVPFGLEQVGLAYVWLTASLSLAWMLFILWFPDGRFTSGRWRGVFAAAVVVTVGASVAGWLFEPAGTLAGPIAGVAVPAGLAGPFAGQGGSAAGAAKALDALQALPLVALLSLFGRFRRSDSLVRQQIRWLLAAAAVTVAAAPVAVALEHGGGSLQTTGLALTLATQPLPALAASAAILRYRLWEIELVVSRALVYVILWALLSLVLVVPALAAGVLVGGSGAAVAVALALAVTLLFQPLRTRLERLAEQLAYRHRPRGHRLLRVLAEELQSEAPHLGDRLAETLRAGVGVRWAALAQLDADGRSVRPGGAAGIDLPPATLLGPELGPLPAEPVAGEEVTERLSALWPARPAAVVPLIAERELVGLLACGPRPGDPLRHDDVELLAAAGRQLALALRNRDLTTELRARLAQIEAQAADLRRSRQRLVAAQDVERRRIERNLHDGVQQQLVALAVRLRRAHEAPEASPELLRELATEAEETIFALQDLARGIFPSVLADQGLAAALRTQAGRMPLNVRVEVEPQLAGRRFNAEVETALYFVALEALTNAQKHAPAARVTLGIRTGAAHVRSLVLDVHDDGPGFDLAAVRDGSGLENMHDRIAAVGGTLRIDTRPGVGTWLAAEVPLEAETIALQPGGADSRR